MPYTVSQLKSDSRFEGLPDAALEIFVAAYNAAYDQYNGDEAKAAATAWSAVKRKYRKGADGKWAEFAAEEVLIKTLSDLRAVGFSEHEAQLRALREAGVDFSVEREAKLFEAGDYPDKGISVSEDELDAIIAAHQDEPPLQLKVEHTDTVFDGEIGVVKALWRKGRELLATLSFTDPAWAFLKGLSIRGLSVALKRDKSGIAEISLVREPRIADARVFAEGTVGFSAALDWQESAVETKHTQEVTIPMPDDVEQTVEQAVATAEPTEVERQAVLIRRMDGPSPDGRAKDLTAMSAENADLRKKLAEQTAETRSGKARSVIDDLMRAGKIVPAAEVFAQVILLHGTEVTEFSHGGQALKETLADTFLRFVNTQPKVVEFEREYLAVPTLDGMQFSPEEIARAAKLGNSAEDLQKYATR